MMRIALKLACAALVASCAQSASFAAEFPYSIDATLYYIGGAPADGKFLSENFLFPATPRGVDPKYLDIHAELSTGPGTPVLQQLVCPLGEIKAGWTVGYRGVHCGWPKEIIVPPGKTLHARVSNAFGPFVAGNLASTFPVVTEAVKPYPGKPPQACAPPSAASRAGAGSRVSVNVFQMPGAIASDGTLDQTKICVVATPHGQDVVGLTLWGSLTARVGGKESYVGSYLCTIAQAPDVTPDGKSVVCTPWGNNNDPQVMFVPRNAKLFVATTVTFGHVQSTPGAPVPVMTYGTPRSK